MIFLLISLLIANIVCQDDYTPVMIIEIYKHGSSTPVLGNPLNREYINRLGNKRLTEYGMRQHLNLGIDIRHKYKELISSIESENEVKVFSSSSRASVISAMSHNLGLFKSLTKQRLEKFIPKMKIRPLWNSTLSLIHI